MGLVQGGHELVHVVRAVIDRQRSARGGADAQRVHQRHGAVMAAADRHAFLVEDAGQVLRMRAVHHEGQDAAFASGRADEFEARHFAQLLRAVGEEGLFVLVDGWELVIGSLVRSFG